MARPIWQGQISFGLVNIPVSLHGAERRGDLHFRLLDGRNQARVRYERINEETGEEVPWGEIVRAFEYDKGNYVVIEQEDLNRAQVKGTQTVELEQFVAAREIDVRYFDKPYYLLPGKRGEKGYVLLRETLAQSERVGLCRVVIRTRQHLAALLPCGAALILNLLRYPEELRAPEEFDLPQGGVEAYELSAREVRVAKQLVDAMTEPFEPEAFHDEYTAALRKLIDQRLAAAQTVQAPAAPEAAEAGSDNVVDMMALLKQSVAERKARADKPASADGNSRKRAR